MDVILTAPELDCSGCRLWVLNGLRSLGLARFDNPEAVSRDNNISASSHYQFVPAPGEGKDSVDHPSSLRNVTRQCTVAILVFGWARHLI